MYKCPKCGNDEKFIIARTESTLEDAVVADGNLIILDIISSNVERNDVFCAFCDKGRDNPLEELD